MIVNLDDSDVWGTLPMTDGGMGAAVGSPIVPLELASSQVGGCAGGAGWGRRRSMEGPLQILLPVGGQDDSKEGSWNWPGAESV